MSLLSELFSKRKRLNLAKRPYDKAFVGTVTVLIFLLVFLLLYQDSGESEHQGDVWDYLLEKAPDNITERVKEGLSMLKNISAASLCDDYNFGWRACLEEKIGLYQDFFEVNCQVFFSRMFPFSILP